MKDETIEHLVGINQETLNRIFFSFWKTQTNFQFTKKTLQIFKGILFDGFRFVAPNDWRKAIEYNNFK